MTLIVRASLLVSLVFSVSACTQPMAKVELKGQHSYAQNGVNTYVPFKLARSDYRPTTYVSTEQTASVQPISVSDVPAPTPAPTKTKAIQSKQVASNVNPWTNKPRAVSSEESLSLSRKEPPRLAASNQGFMWPVNSRKVVSSFGPKGGGKVNDGINIASAEGEPVWASADGEVIYVGNELQGYGNMILVRHAGNKNTTYANLSRTNVDKYDRVKQGDIIGYVGSTGNVKSPQLHFAIRDGKDPLDPSKYLSRNLASK